MRNPSEELLFDRLMETLREAERLPYPRHDADVECKAALDAYVDDRIARALEMHVPQLANTAISLATFGGPTPNQPENPIVTGEYRLPPEAGGGRRA